MQKAPTKCQPMRFPINPLQCQLRIVEKTTINSNGGSVIFKYFKIPRREKKGALYRRTFEFPWEFFVGTFFVVFDNMAGNDDINMPGINILWCYSCGSVCFQYCLLSHD